ncbi:MAG: deoxynucleoside kinase [Anaerolineales bacterium]
MYLAVEGVIGVGKTTLVRLLQAAFEAETCLEVFEENPFLSSFYADRERYAFQTQMFFLLSRYHQQRRDILDIVLAKKNLIVDYTFDKDTIFARLNLKGDELEMYHRVHDALAEKVASPDLVVYLRADTSTLMKRIAQRDRPYERNMEWAYIDQLNQVYDTFYAEQQKKSSVLIIDTNDLDFVRNTDDLMWVENRIRQTLKLAPFQPELPLP